MISEQQLHVTSLFNAAFVPVSTRDETVSLLFPIAVTANDVIIYDMSRGNRVLKLVTSPVDIGGKEPCRDINSDQTVGYSQYFQ